MPAIQEAKKQILLDLKRAFGKEFSPTVADLTTPPDAELGDLAFPCFALGKALKRNPAELATELAAKIEPNGFVKKASAAGPYVNFTLDDVALGTAVLEEIASGKDGYGRSTSGEGKRVLVEFANPNTHKDIHVGHLRNFFVGQAVINLLNALGSEVIPVSYINDLGANVAKCLWAIKHKAPDEKVGKDDRMEFLGRMYVEAVKAEEADPAVKAAISAIQRELEDLRGPYVKLWKKTQKWSVDAIRATFKELGLTIVKTYFESDLIGDTKRIVESLIQKGIASHSEGAWIVNLEEEKLGVNLLVKSDGTLLYNAKDLALAYKKDADYHPGKSLYVIDARQSLAMKQLFATMKKLGFHEELVHVGYEFVTLKEGAMSSRKGNIVRYQTFRDEAIAAAAQETKARHADWSEKKLASVSRAVAFAAFRFGMLKQDVDKQITFDMKEAVAFDGFTGPYLLYTLARCYSLLKKAGRAKPSRSADGLEKPADHRLILALAKYPETVFEAATELRPNALAQYLFDLGKAFAAFYDAAPILSAPPKERAARLGLVDATRQVLENGLDLLGIGSVKEM
jgi:arginyl-tRNA synthetase